MLHLLRIEEITKNIRLINILLTKYSKYDISNYSVKY